MQRPVGGGGTQSPGWCKYGGAGPKNENLWVLTHPAIIVFAVAADAISQALMGLNFTLDSPHCPQQMTNAVCPAVRAAGGSGRRCPASSDSLWPQREALSRPRPGDTHRSGEFLGVSGSPGGRVQERGLLGVRWRIWSDVAWEVGTRAQCPPRWCEQAAPLRFPSPGHEGQRQSRPQEPAALF